MRYLLTGGSGYIGGQYARYLLVKGHHVTFLRRPSPSLPQKLIQIIDGFPPSQVEIEIYSSPFDLIKPVSRVDRVVHLAALYDRRIDRQTASELVKSNILLSTELLATVGECNPKIPIVTASTFSAYNCQGEYAPVNLYAATKDAVERIAAAFSNTRSGFLRLAETFGPEDSRPKVHNLVRNSIIRGEGFEFYAPAEQIINLTYVGDVISAFEALLVLMEENKAQSPLIYDFMPQENFISLGEMAELLFKDTGLAPTFPQLLHQSLNAISLEPHNLPTIAVERPVRDHLRSTLGR